MIYVSSSGVRRNTIKETVMFLADNGFRNIELSGGTHFYPSIEDDLLMLKDEYGLRYQCHNYFPPPEKDFVVNLASLNDDIYQRSIDHCLNALNLSGRLGGRRYGVHAGFFVDVEVTELGKIIVSKALMNKQKAIQRFCEAVRYIRQNSNGIDIYIENNVLSCSNYQEHGCRNIFMLTSYLDYIELKERLDFKLLLDVAHLKVSSTTLGFDFNTELDGLLSESDYIHISDNDGLHDLNQSIEGNSPLCDILKSRLVGKDVTLEIYGDISDIKSSYRVIREIVSDS
ncbi:MAG: TIM barrel protein [Methylomonas sp.]|nr:TIM barrel protein [Methylomonas sp.]